MPTAKVLQFYCKSGNQYCVNEEEVSLTLIRNALTEYSARSKAVSYLKTLGLERWYNGNTGNRTKDYSGA